MYDCALFTGSTLYVFVFEVDVMNLEFLFSDCLLVRKSSEDDKA